MEKIEDYFSSLEDENERKAFFENLFFIVFDSNVLDYNRNHSVGRIFKDGVFTVLVIKQKIRILNITINPTIVSDAEPSTPTSKILSKGVTFEREFKIGFVNARLKDIRIYFYDHFFDKKSYFEINKDGILKLIEHLKTCLDTKVLNELMDQDEYLRIPAYGEITSLKDFNLLKKKIEVLEKKKSDLYDKFEVEGEFIEGNRCNHWYFHEKSEFYCFLLCYCKDIGIDYEKGFLNSIIIKDEDMKRISEFIYNNNLNCDNINKTPND